MKLIIQIQSRCISDPTLSDIDFKNKVAWVPIILESMIFESVT